MVSNQKMEAVIIISQRDYASPFCIHHCKLCPFWFWNLEEKNDI